MTDQRLGLLDLPFDILGSILKHISFVDYVQLNFTSNQALRIFNCKEFYKIVWKANFAAATKAYEWHVPDEILMRQNWRDIYYRMRMLNNELCSIRKEFFSQDHILSPTSSKKQITHVSRLWDEFYDDMIEKLNDFGFEEHFFIPLLCLSQIYSDKFSAAVKDRRVHDMYLMCISKQLLHIQVYNSIYFYFEKLGSETNSDFTHEKCLFVLSKFNFEFLEWAHTRQTIFNAIRRNIRRKDIRKAGAHYTDEEAFHDRIQNFGTEILRFIPELPMDKDSHIRVLHNRRVSDLMRHSILAKFLNEAILHLPIRIDRVERNFKANITKSLVAIGSFRYKILKDSKLFELTSERSAIMDLKDTIKSQKFNIFYDREVSDDSKAFSERIDRLSVLAGLSQGEPVGIDDLAGFRPQWTRHFRSHDAAGRSGIVQATNVGLVIHTDWAFEDGGSLVCTAYDANFDEDIICVGSRELSLPEDVKEIMSWGGFNLMGTQILSKVVYRLGEYRFMESDRIGSRSEVRL